MLQQLLEEQQIQPAQVIQFDREKVHHFNLSKHNKALEEIDLNDEDDFTNYIFNVLDKHQCTVGIGGYGEERSLYARSDLFQDEEPRTIHLGIDIWAPAGTPVFAPLAAKVHSFDNRAYHGDYGPVIILEHEIGPAKLYGLYGHLSQASLEGKRIGQSIAKGEQFASLGNYDENFHWPPHLHFQLMWDMEGLIGDYPGVCKASEKDHFLANCPDPKIFL